MEDLLFVKVKTTQADYHAFYAYTASQVLKSYTWIPILKNVLLWLVLVFSLMAFFQFQAGAIEKKPLLFVLATSIPFFIYVALSRLLDVKIAQSFTPNEHGLMIGPKEFEISADGIKETHPHGFNVYHWDSVQQIAEVNGSIYVFVDKVLAIIFNAESLKSDDVKQQLLRTLHQYAEQSSSASRP